jgi:hypothetical protein
MEAEDRYHAIYRIMFPISYRYAKPGCRRLETPHYRYIPHDESQGSARSRQEWETDQGHHQEPRVSQWRCQMTMRMSCELSVEYSMQAGDHSILYADQH